MKKVWIVLSLFFLVLLGACSNQTVNKQADSKQKEQVTKPKHLNDIVAYFKKDGFTIGGKSQKAYQMIGAIDGFAITINNEPVELYEFDPKQSNGTLEKTKTSGTFANNTAIANKNFMLVEDNNDPEQTKIGNIFKNFN